ncbi:MAG: N-acetylmuramoyl-L-alanine amidase [Oscillospiraceae bacterium]|nr:N-acetylmuramoyl-L-alanine amidase [Oscillospiraceae bacterium]
MSKICFIVGHGKSKSGGYDPGAVAGDVHEFRIAKEIAEYAQTYYNANFTEQADIMNDDASLYLTDRIKKINAAGYDFAAEIHLNAGGGTGTECYYHKGSEDGKRYAAEISSAICEALGVAQRGAKTRLNASGRDYFAIIRETACTAVLIETVFIDSPADLAKLAAPEGQAACGAAIAQAIAKVHGVKHKSLAAQKPTGPLYRVQVGAFRNRTNAEALLAQLRNSGFADAFVKAEE